MQVVLLQDIKGIGRKMEVKNVSDGYARNFLFPKKLAVPADEGGLEVKSSFDAQERGLIEKIKAEAKRLEGEQIIIPMKQGGKGEIFQSVNADKIKKALVEKGYVDCEVVLEKPIRQAGEYTVAVKFKRGITAETKVILKPE